MEIKKIVADFNGKKIVITKQCGDCEAHPVKRGKYLPPCDTPAIGNYTPPKPLEECISYEEANAPIMGNPFNFINWDVVNAERAKQGTKD
jgi:hypothetical protein